MFHFFPGTPKRSDLSFGVLSVLLLFVSFPGTLRADETTQQIVSIAAREADSRMEVRITGSHPLITTAYELPNPARIIVDVAEAKPAPEMKPQLGTNNHVKLAISEISDAKPPITRLEFTLSETLPYTTTQEGNDLILSIDTKTAQKSLTEQQPAVATAKDSSAAALQLQEVKVITKAERTVIQLLASGEPIDFTHHIVEKKEGAPPRLNIDVNNIVCPPSLQKEQTVGTSVAKIRTAARESGVRIVLDSALKTLFPFKIEKIKNGIEILIDEPKEKDQVSTLINQKKGIDGQLPEIDPLAAKSGPRAKGPQATDTFEFAGYNKERITVEFQKMDLHNVFNFMRQVSGVNIVVDESVQGSLTLVLDDVPWDFALDIILNLKDLEKEERFNTLVIYPKGKGFQWSEQAQNNLSFEANTAVVEKEALIIKQQGRQSIGVVEAKQQIAAAQEAEKQENFETAVQLYEKAQDKWPENSKLANKIASLYLVQLRQNAKALYYSQKALASDATNSAASLNAAIASANMQDKQMATRYFEQSISSKKPSRESLLSYATFIEEQKEYPKALKILEKHDALFGNDLNSMVAAARIYDKMDRRAQATGKYQAILLSGFRIPPDLEKFINDRVAVKQSM